MGNKDRSAWQARFRSRRHRQAVSDLRFDDTDPADRVRASIGAPASDADLRRFRPHIGRRCRPARKAVDRRTVWPCVTDACAVADELERRGTKLAPGALAHDAAEPTGRMFVDVLGTLAEFRADLIPLRMREGMVV